MCLRDMAFLCRAASDSGAQDLARRKIIGSYKDLGQNEESQAWADIRTFGLRLIIRFYCLINTK